MYYLLIISIVLIYALWGAACLSGVEGCRLQLHRWRNASSLQRAVEDWSIWQVDLASMRQNPRWKPCALMPRYPYRA